MCSNRALQRLTAAVQRNSAARRVQQALIVDGKLFLSPAAWEAFETLSDFGVPDANKETLCEGKQQLLVCVYARMPPFNLARTTTRQSAQMQRHAHTRLSAPARFDRASLCAAP
eukprot:21220-Heterococcus_DN1.PRE.1